MSDLVPTAEQVYTVISNRWVRVHEIRSALQRKHNLTSVDTISDASLYTALSELVAQGLIEQSTKRIPRSPKTTREAPIYRRIGSGQSSGLGDLVLA